MRFPALASTEASKDRARTSSTQAIVSALVVGLIVATSFSNLAVAGEWAGTETTKNGVVHVENPAEPRDGAVTLELEELWRLGGDTDAEEEFFGVIAAVRTDEAGNIYLLDAQLNEIKIFSPEGEYINSIGREGEGPGEFRGPGDMFIRGDGTVGVQQVAPGKIVLLSPDGEPAGEMPVPAVEGDGFRFMRGTRWIGGNFAVASSVGKFENGVYEQSHDLDVVDAEGNVLKNLHSSKSAITFGAEAVVSEKEWDGFYNRMDVTRDGRILSACTFGKYEVNMWNSDGELERVITREIKHRKRTAAEKDRLRRIFEAFLAQVPNGKAEIEDLDSDITRLWGRDDGSMWVLSSWGGRDLEPGVLGVFDVFDKEGRFVRQVTLKGEGEPQIDGYFFDKDRLYVVTDFILAAAAAQGTAVEGEDDEEAEPMAVICYKIDDKAGI